MNHLEQTLYAKGYRPQPDGSWSKGPPQAGYLAPVAVVQSDSVDESLAESARKIADPVRRFVRITSYKFRLVDRDAVWVKYLIDALRRAGALYEDTTAWLEYEVHQVKVSHPRHERTEVEIT